HLDLNRLSQVSANAPWFLEMILERLTAIVARNRHATILVVHGWNIIQPRVDLGLGLRRHGDHLRPPGAARVSASDAFIHGPPGELRRRCIAALGEVFGSATRSNRNGGQIDKLVVVRTAAAKRPAPAKLVTTPATPTRVGIELFDPSAKIGAMASFDLGAGG